jgi:hypothetical protein
LIKGNTFRARFLLMILLDLGLKLMMIFCLPLFLILIFASLFIELLMYLIGSFDWNE